MNININVTEAEWRRVRRLASFRKMTVDDLASEGILAVVEAWEDDLAIEPLTGRIIGEKTESPRLN